MHGFPARNPGFLPFHQHIAVSPAAKTGNIIVIPAYRETGIDVVLNSLVACDPPDRLVEVIVVVNSSESDSQDIRDLNRRIYLQLIQKAETLKSSFLRVFPMIYEDLPAKDAGVGMARRLGMDEAAYRFHHINNSEGIITSLDADCRVAKNYLCEIEKAFSHTHADVAVISFEHPLDSGEFTSAMIGGAMQYELYLRYFLHGLRYCGYPWAWHTVGSAFAVSVKAYLSHGGMNLRQGGEDFYFLQKIFKSGNTTEITETTVYPSPRPSDRVPFGTGPVVARFASGDKHLLETYNLDAFLDLKRFFTLARTFFEASGDSWLQLYDSLPVSLKEYYPQKAFAEEMEEIKKNVASAEAFLKRFFRKFDTFRIIKYLNYVHEHGLFPRKPVTREAARLLSLTGLHPEPDTLRLLEQYRALDRSPAPRQ